MKRNHNHNWSVMATVVIASLAARSFGITALSQSDPSLAGTVLQDVEGINLTAYGGTPPPPGFEPSPFASADEKVVRNDIGTLDFYYRFSPLPGQNVSADWIELFPLSQTTRISFAYLTDGPGDLAPITSASGPLIGGPDGQYAAFGFQSGTQEVTLDAAGTKWLFLRTDAKTYTNSAGVSFPPFVLTSMGEGAIVPSLFGPADSGPVPEPKSILLLPVGVLALVARGRFLAK